MFTPSFLKETPIESHHVAGKKIAVYRADLVPKPPLAPYLKMIELYPFIRDVAKKYKLIAYYAVPESEWVVSMPPIAESFGIQALIGISATKQMPAYVDKIDSKNLLKLPPNMYKVNYSRTRKYVEERGGLMIPMGLECQEVVDGMREFLDKSPIPKKDTIIVPVGSGVALCGILNHLRGKSHVVGICTRPRESVARVVAKYVKYDNYILHNQEAGMQKRDDLPFPMHRFWDQNAYEWMENHIKHLRGSVCFINLGSGARIGSQ